MNAPDDLPDLTGRRVLLGVTGSIAAYKAALLVRLLKKAGAEVQVIMTPSAERFIPALTLGTLSEREVLGEIFPDNEDGSWTKHVSLGLWADVFVVAPATAQTVAKLAHGFSDTMLTATALSATCPMLVCPAMDRDMYQHPATRDNIERLQGFGYDVMPAAHGELASGLVGQGRMPEPEAIVARIAQTIRDASESLEATPHSAHAGDGHARDGHAEQTAAAHAEETSPSAETSTHGPLSGKTVLVTAGPTQEPLDPVRMLTNPSTGRMGYALARGAAERGAKVTLVSGPTSLEPPDGVEVVRVRTAAEMNDAVQQRRDEADVIVGAAAVADYTPAAPSDTKRKKQDDDLTVRLTRTPDILKTVGQNKRDGQVLVGFALETDDGPANARRKLQAKNLDWIVLNNPTESGAGFATETNRVTLFSTDGDPEPLPLLSKDDVAGEILDRVAASLLSPSTS